MRSYLGRGDYNHNLSHDELDGFDYLYGHDLDFTEVPYTGGIVIGDIVIKAASLGSSGTWAEGGPTDWFYRNPLIPFLGAVTTEGTITFNTTSSKPMGFKTLGTSWSFLGGGEKEAIEVVTRGTNNPTPINDIDNGIPRVSTTSSDVWGPTAKTT
jgi:hypothetical protein